MEPSRAASVAAGRVVEHPLPHATRTDANARAIVAAVEALIADYFTSIA